MTISENWFWGISNNGEADLVVWLEPWAEEFEVRSRSTLTVNVTCSDATEPELDIEQVDGRIVIWSGSGQLLQFFMDGVALRTASATLEFPKLSGPGTKDLITILFKGHPQARLGGENHVEAKTSLGRKLKRWLRL